MQKILLLYKEVAETPLEAVEKYRKLHPELAGVKLGYAGRLDPMAEGLLLVLVGEENKKRSNYLSLDKKYEAQMVLGISTDSHDLLGALLETKPVSSKIREKIPETLKGFTGEILQQIPHFSSYRVAGKPLFKWMRDGEIHKISIPKKKRKIIALTEVKIGNLPKKELEKKVELRISKIQGAFRQAEILDKWRLFLHETKETDFITIKFCVHCSSGTYIRMLAHDIGQKLESGGFLYTLKRIAIGSFTIEDI